MTAPELLSILVPVYNESRTVASVIDRLRSIDLPVPREIVVVNDGSSDGTREVLDAYPHRGDALRIVHVEPNAGKGAAIRLGLRHARGTIIAIQDADLELDPAQLAALVAPIAAGDTSVVFGSRFLAGRPDAPWLTVAANRTLTLVTNLLFGARITDMETCYKVMRTDVARSLDLESNRFDIEPEITAKLLLAGHRILELPVYFKPRQRAEGKKIGWHDGFRALRVLASYRFGGWRPSSQPKV
jgi:glycosyltransferase involved in cell wall biosynthesis